MGKTPVFLTLAEVVEIHSDQIERYGGDTGIRDTGLLESALSQPEASFAGAWLHPDFFEMAAAYAFHLAKNHPFLDGNKRAALACALVFLEMNRIGIVDPKGVLVKAMLDVVSGKLGKQALAKLFRKLPKDHRK